jgi:hypothetical protein
MQKTILDWSMARILRRCSVRAWLQRERAKGAVSVSLARRSLATSWLQSCGGTLSYLFLGATIWLHVDVPITPLRAMLLQFGCCPAGLSFWSDPRRQPQHARKRLTRVWFNSYIQASHSADRSITQSWLDDFVSQVGLHKPGCCWGEQVEHKMFGCPSLNWTRTIVTPIDFVNTQDCKENGIVSPSPIIPARKFLDG